MRDLRVALSSAEKLKGVTGEGADAIERIGEMIFAAEDVRAVMRKVLDASDCSAFDADKLSARLDVVSKLKRKYGGSIAKVLETADEYEKALLGMEDCEADRKGLEKRLSEVESELVALMSRIRKAREAYVAGLDRDITMTFGELAVGDGKFVTSIKGSDMEFSDDSVEFCVSLNGSGDLRQLRKSASGGETARIFLALLSRDCRKSDAVDLFDEIDSGVSGKSADKLSEYLVKIAGTHQVIAVTHNASVAAKASGHILVRKRSIGGKTSVEAESVSGEERVGEIERMLSGSGHRNAASFAAELLERKGC